ncbi:hypothetical protein OG921_24075 [Aldersonia sp. NBC_00410]|uniref:hypothetical protein n=1 Tax=Aldersonia sp. NBC_00410 TaxID=2975954 RepID=UPI0022580E27|nr:hypothetical protein [Aldersonia sp. NBC_00410]MCX5046253.1 hypothetical protein [Aldersonia sp. NBC_00410]
MCAFREVQPITTFRKHLPAFMKQVDVPGARVYVGAYRKAEAVLMSVNGELPDDVRDELVRAFGMREAGQARARIAAAGHLDQVGEPMGRVVTWMWRSQPEEAAAFLRRFVADLAANPDTEPPIVLADLLRALRASLPEDFGADEYAELCARTQLGGSGGDVDR